MQQRKKFQYVSVALDPNVQMCVWTCLQPDPHPSTYATPLRTFGHRTQRGFRFPMDGLKRSDMKQRHDNPRLMTILHLHPLLPYAVAPVTNRNGTLRDLHPVSVILGTEPSLEIALRNQQWILTTTSQIR